VSQGEFQKAILVLERGLDLSETWGFTLILPGIAGALGYAHALSGRADRGLSLLQRGVDLTAGRASAFQLVLFGEASLVAGRQEEAVTAARRALAFARTHKERLNEAWALRLLGEIASHGDPTDPAADADYRQALALAAELRMRPLVAHCHFGLGKLYRRTGQRLESEAHLTTAMTMYREMDMRFWLEQADAEIGDLT
jgi:tetratricopeptide (TPR) repeat protein